jgi:hypothetical protein
LSIEPQAGRVDESGRSTQVVRLDWQGPYELDELVDGLRSAERCPGIYLWTLPLDDQLKIAYVGQASNVRDRMYQHIFYTLGGAYCLYGPDDVRAGRVSSITKDLAYEPGLEGVIQEFLPRLRELQRTAEENLRCYRYFWAEMRGWSGSGARDRRLVESALIGRARDNPDCLQNARLSLAPCPDTALKVESSFGEQQEIEALKRPIEYPVRRPSSKPS